MAKIDDVLNLTRAHFDGDDEAFLAALTAIAANEAAAGRRMASDRIHSAINRRPAIKKMHLMTGEAVAEGLLFGRKTPLRLSDMVLAPKLKVSLERIFQEQQNREKLLERNLDAARKILLFGPSGVGKTMTAAVIAGELDIPLYTVSSDRVVNSYLGETAKNLKKIFEFIPRSRGVYFFDEFDSLARERGTEHDVGEMTRVMGSLLQFIERDTSNSIIVAATNLPGLLDKALHRRFDSILHYDLPSKSDISTLIQMTAMRVGIQDVLSGDMVDVDVQRSVAEALDGKSQAMVVRACEDSAKDLLLAGEEYDWKGFLAKLQARLV